MKLKKFHRIVAETSEETKENIRFSMSVLERLNELLDQKFDGKQKLLADKLGKTEAEVSKWFSGMQNFTLKTLIKLQVAFGEPIIAVCSSDEHDATFTQVKVPYKKFKTSLAVDTEGKMCEKVEYKTLNKTGELSKNINQKLSA